jgi:hypothetical protein
VKVFSGLPPSANNPDSWVATQQVVFNAHDLANMTDLFRAIAVKEEIARAPAIVLQDARYILFADTRAA